MAVQDDSREVEIRELLGLRQGGTRAGVDAYFDFVAQGDNYAVPVELKSTTGRTVSTARDVGPSHIAKWRARLWIFGFYDGAGANLESLLVLGPDALEPWIAKVEAYIRPDFLIGERAAQHMTLEDLHIICGERTVYGLDDAQALHKRQWTNAEYRARMDLPDGYSPATMLEILRLRVRYLSDRGATLNNPHIPKGFFAPFRSYETAMGTDLGVVRHTVTQRMRSIVLSTPALSQFSGGT